MQQRQVGQVVRQGPVHQLVGVVGGAFFFIILAAVPREVVHERVGGGAAQPEAKHGHHVEVRVEHLAPGEPTVLGDVVGVELLRGASVLILGCGEDGRGAEEAELLVAVKRSHRQEAVGVHGGACQGRSRRAERTRTPRR